MVRVQSLAVARAESSPGLGLTRFGQDCPVAAGVAPPTRTPAAFPLSWLGDQSAPRVREKTEKREAEQRFGTSRFSRPV
jgi:hypothetical protein